MTTSTDVGSEGELGKTLGHVGGDVGRCPVIKRRETLTCCMSAPMSVDVCLMSTVMQEERQHIGADVGRCQADVVTDVNGGVCTSVPMSVDMCLMSPLT